MFNIISITIVEVLRLGILDLLARLPATLSTPTTFGVLEPQTTDIRAKSG